ncbi:hypothetical protein [Actinokineospora sp. HUAS TT18]|uniref:hypothetical protein n=1 Tax=Actinokineospora sp. HUAS TT18 TaxID=3447451 RepID=UPI003F51E169
MDIAAALAEARTAWETATDDVDQAAGAAYAELREALAAEIGVCVTVLERR